jgi:hypothetical protein
MGPRSEDIRCRSCDRVWDRRTADDDGGLIACDDEEWGGEG